MVVLNPVDDERYLASLLLSITARSLREDALEKVQPDDFCSGNLGGLWGVAQKLHVNGKKIDKRSLIAASESSGTPKLLWDLEKLGPPAAGDYPQALAEVQRCGRLRRLCESLQRSMQRALTAEEYSEAVAVAYEELGKLDAADDTALNQRLDVLLGRLEDSFRSRTDYQIIETPWPDLNRHISGGLHPGRFYVVGARPGNGKSIAAHNMAEYAASKGRVAQVFSVEMGGIEVAGRIASAAMSIDMGEISRRELSDYSWYQFQQYRETAVNYELYVDESPELSIGHVWSVCRARKRQTGLDVVVVDYLQLVKGDVKVPREQQVASISRSCKQLSRELQCAVVVPTQLNRKATDRDKASMSDLRESGAIEQDSDVIIMLARQYADDGDMKGVPNGMVSVDIPKNRHGQEASFELPFRGHYSRIG
jgi:replicative DNA helicase